jgi:hypothetical protein
MDNKKKKLFVRIVAGILVALMVLPMGISLLMTLFA